MGELTDKIKAGVNQTVGKAKESIGKETNDPDLAAKGAAQDTKGKAQSVKGSVKGALGDDI